MVATALELSKVFVRLDQPVTAIDWFKRAWCVALSGDSSFGLAAAASRQRPISALYPAASSTLATRTC